MEERVDEIYTLKVIAEVLNRSNDLGPMLQQVLEKLLDLTDLTTGWIFLAGNEPDYHLMASHGLPPALSMNSQEPMCNGICYCLTKFWKGELTQPVNIIHCRRIEKAIQYNWGDTADISHHATIPLTGGEETFGVLNVAAPKKEIFDSHELDLLQSVAFQIGTAIKRIRLYEKRQEMQLLDERNRLARDLHDAVSQKLFSLSLTAQGALSLLSPEDLQLTEALQDIKGLAKGAMGEMKAMIWQLRPYGLENGLISAVKEYAESLNVKLSIESSRLISFSPQIKETIWRILQEALNNIHKHAKIGKADLCIDVAPEHIKLTITDYGVGFNINKLRNDQGSLGLTSMRERVERVNGCFTVQSETGKGTVLIITIPLMKEKGGQRP